MPPVRPAVRVRLALAVLLVSVATTPCARAPRGALAAAGPSAGAAASTSAAFGLADVPDVDMPAGLLATMDGRELWSREATASRAMASTTKIMTAIVAMQHADLDETVRVGEDAVSVGESEAGLGAGESASMRELLEAMLVKSGNDAAIAIADHVGSSEQGFVRLMDAEARRLGLSHTDFDNPHGLDAEGHHTCARDLATLSRFAMTYPEFRRIVGMREVTISGSRGRPVTLENSNVMLKEYRGATGIKTGWTDDAGYCLVATASRGGVGLVAVVLGAESERDRFDQAEALLDWGFARYRRREVASAGRPLGTVRVSDWLDVSVPVQAAETTSAAVYDADGPLVRRLALPDEVRAPVRRGQRLGTLTVTQGDRLVSRVPLVAAGGVDAPSFWQRVRVRAVRMWRAVAGGW